MAFAAEDSTQPGSKKQGDYWGNRQGAVYLAAAKRICHMFCPEPASVVDVGSNATPTLEWHRAEGTRLVSVDRRRPYVAEGVESIKGDFFAYDTTVPFELVTCFQVLEHVTEARPFAQKLLESGRTLVVSVPYRWPKGACKHHVHDPVTDAKMLSWFGRAPTYRYVASEPVIGMRRLIHVYAPPEVIVVGSRLTTRSREQELPLRARVHTLGRRAKSFLGTILR